MKLTMMKVSVLALTTLVVLGISSSAAANAEVKFIEPKKFHDVEVTGFNRNTGIEMVQKQLNEMINEVTSTVIPESETLLIEVTDIDLAGYMEYFFGPTNRDMRIVTDHDRYRLEFKYQLKTNSGEVKKEGAIHIKEFLYRLPREPKYSKYQLVNYMRDDIEKWANQTFSQ